MHHTCGARDQPLSWKNRKTARICPICSPENELLMTPVRTGRSTRAEDAGPAPRYQPVPPLVQEAPLELPVAPTLEQTVRTRHDAGHSQRAIADELNLDRRKVKRILDQAA